MMTSWVVLMAPPTPPAAEPLPSRQSDVETTSKQRQSMSSDRRRKGIENANGIDVDRSTSLRCRNIDVVSTLHFRRRINVE